MKILSVLALMAAATVQSACIVMVSAVTPVDFIPHRFHSGQMYQQALAEQRAAGREVYQRRQQQLRREGGLLGMSFSGGDAVGDADGLGAYRNTTDNFFPQFIDHNNKSRGTFQQRYFVDYSYWDGKGPTCLYISGENIAAGSPSGFVQQYAQSVNALMFTLEHRWYGKSNLSANYSDMALMDTLTIDNALADLVYFMDYVDAEVIGQKLRWFAVGGSYAGGLSAWLKTVYPDRIEAAWSSSGVTNPKFDYYEYEGHVVSVLPPLCANTIKLAINQIEAQWDDAAKYDEIQSLFGVANMTKAEFSYLLGDIYSGPVQYGTKATMCDMLVPMGSDPLAQFAAMNAKLNGVQFGPRFAMSRLGKKQQMLSVVGGSEKGAVLGASLEDPNMSGWLWNFQCCSQMAFWQIGYPSVGTQGTCLRPSSLTTDGFMDVCARDYGPQYFPDVYALRKRLGGAFPNATKVIAFQASDDPFAPAGVNSQVNPEYPFVLAQCDGCAHCFDLRAPLPTDPAGLVQSRRTIVQYMNKWLGLAFNVTFVLGGAQRKEGLLNAKLGDAALMGPADAASFQAILLQAMPGQTDLSAMVYGCDAAPSSSSSSGTTKCYSTFTSNEAAVKAIGLANNGTIPGVTSAYVSVPSNDGTSGDGSGISRGAIAGIVVGSVVGCFLVLGGIGLVVRRRRRGDDGGYHTVNDALH